VCCERAASSTVCLVACLALCVGCCLEYRQVSPRSQGLFHRALMESGPFAQWSAQSMDIAEAKVGTHPWLMTPLASMTRRAGTFVPSCLYLAPPLSPAQN
jgi:hypothetical protein